MQEAKEFISPFYQQYYHHQHSSSLLGSNSPCESQCWKEINETQNHSASGQFPRGCTSCQCSTPPSLSYLQGLKLSWSSKINHSSFNALSAYRIEKREQNTDVTGVFHGSAGMTGDNKCSVHCEPSWAHPFTSASWFFQVSKAMPVFPSLFILSFPHALLV